MSRRMSRLLQVLERVCLLTGLLGLGLVGIVSVDAALGNYRSVAAFQQAVAEVSGGADRPVEWDVEGPDQTLWSERAREKYLHAQAEAGVPLALMKIPRLNLEVPVFEGTDRLTLNRGAGVVEGTALPSESGNVVLSAHRDSYFRALKDIAVGDAIELQTLQGSRLFEVAETFITDPLDVSVLDPAETPLLTLITCYPFYYVGFAPDRFIVRALPAGRTVGERAAEGASAQRSQDRPVTTL